MEIDPALLDTMYKIRLRNRFSDTDKYNHIAVIVNGKPNGKRTIISTGINHHASHYPGMSSIHAEHDAILKLPYAKKRTVVQLFVARFTKSGDLCMSRPCTQCIYQMARLERRSAYVIYYVYYSTGRSSIHRERLLHMCK